MTTVRTLHTHRPVRGRTTGEWIFHAYRAAVALFLVSSCFGDGPLGSGLQAMVFLSGVQLLISAAWAVLFSGALSVYFLAALLNFLAIAGVFILAEWLGHRRKKRKARSLGRAGPKFESAVLEFARAFLSAPDKGRRSARFAVRAAGALFGVAVLLALFGFRYFLGDALLVLLGLSFFEEGRAAFFPAREAADWKSFFKRGESGSPSEARIPWPEALGPALGVAVSLAAWNPAPAVWLAAHHVFKRIGLSPARLWRPAPGGRGGAIVSFSLFLLGMAPFGWLFWMMETPWAHEVTSQPGVERLTRERAADLAVSPDGESVYALSAEDGALLRLVQAPGVPGKWDRLKAENVRAIGVDPIDGAFWHVREADGRNPAMASRFLPQSETFEADGATPIPDCGVPGRFVVNGPGGPAFLHCGEPAAMLFFPRGLNGKAKPEKISTRSFFGKPRDLDYSPRLGALAFTRNFIASDATVVNPGSSRRLKVFDGDSPLRGAAVHDRERILYVARPYRSDVLAVDLDTFKLLSRRGVSRFPDQIVVLDGPGLLAVTSAAKGWTDFIDPDSGVRVARLLTGRNARLAPAWESGRLYFSSVHGIFAVDLQEHFDSRSAN